MYLFRSAALIAVMMLAACASLDEERIAKFGTSAATLGSALQDTRNIQNSLKSETELEMQATIYSRGSSNFAYPLHRRQSLSVGTGWNTRINFAAALAAYGEALAKAAKGGQEAELGSAVEGLGKAVAEAASNTTAKASLSRVGSAGGPAARLLYRYASVQSAREAITDADPLIREGAKLLEQDLDLLSLQAETRFQGWVISKRAALVTFQDRTEVNAVEKYNAYKLFAGQEREMAAAVSLLVSVDGEPPRYKSLLANMVSAHGALLKPAEASRALDAFIKSVDELADIFAALRGDA